jgi:hypothetical protein
MVACACFNPRTGRLRQENHEFEASLGYKVIPWFNGYIGDLSNTPKQSTDFKSKFYILCQDKNYCYCLFCSWVSEQ